MTYSMDARAIGGLESALADSLSEFGKSEVSIKDLRLGVELSKEVGADRKSWLEQRPAQSSVPGSELVRAVNDILTRYDD